MLYHNSCLNLGDRVFALVITLTTNGTLEIKC